MKKLTSKDQRAVIFDFDGTLADTKSLVLQALNDFAKVNAMPPVHDFSDLREAILANKFKFNFRLLGLKVFIKNLVLDKIAANATELKLQNNLSSVIPMLQKKGYLLGIVTANREETVRRFLKQHGLESFFTFIKSTENKRLCLLGVSKEYDIHLANLFYVCDQADDLAATNTISHTIAVTWGYEKPSQLYAGKPQFLIEAAEDILPIVANQARCYSKNHFSGLGFANSLTARNDQIAYEQALSSLSPANHSRIINQLINLFPLEKARDLLPNWCQAAIFIALNKLFDENGNVHAEIAQCFFPETSMVLHQQEKNKLLQLYLHHFFIEPLKKCLQILGQSLDFQLLEKQIQTDVELSFNDIAKLQQTLLQNNRHHDAPLNQFVVDYIYNRNAYLLKKKLASKELSNAIQTHGQHVLKEVKRLKKTSELPTAALASCLIHVNTVLNNPSEINLKSAAEFSNEISKRTTCQILGYCFKTLLNCIFSSCFSQKKNTTPTTTSGLAAQGLFTKVRYLPLKSEMDALISDLKPSL